MTSVLMKYKCDNAGCDAWHNHYITQAEVDWHDRILHKLQKNGGGNRTTKKGLGKFFGWYTAIKEAIKAQRQHNVANETAVIYSTSFPIPNCCMANRDIDLPYTRHPLLPTQHNQSNNEIPSYREAAKATCETLWKPQKLKPPHHQQEEIMNHQNDDAVDVDENDTIDDRCHFPQHCKNPSKSIVHKAQRSGKK